MAEPQVAAGIAAAPIAAEKRELRRRALAAREALDDAFRKAAGRAALLNLLGQLQLTPKTIVAACWPIGRELDTRPLFEALAALSVTTCLPRMVAKGQPLVFHRYRPGETLREGAMRVLEPVAEAPLLVPDIVVVPLLAFDSAGYRLGYGGGFYDRTLATLGPAHLAIGLAFEAQRLPHLPHEPFDVPLETIVTETGAHRFR